MQHATGSCGHLDQACIIIILLHSSVSNVARALHLLVV